MKRRATMTAGSRSILLFAFVLSCCVALSACATSWVGLSRACEWPDGMPRARVLLIGEVHGTSEAPDFIGQLACAAAGAGRSVIVALEIPPAEQLAIQNFLASRGAADDRSALLEGAFWRRPLQDGRSSAAMLALLNDLRLLKQRGLDVSVTAIDERVGGSRDAGMAARIMAAAEPEKTTLIALLGNYHASQKEGASWDPSYQPAGLRLKSLNPVSVLFSAAAGTAWICAPECGVRPVASKIPLGDGVRYVAGTNLKPGYDGVYSVPLSTASPPAALIPGQPRNESN